MSFVELLNAIETQKKKILEMANGKERLENVKPSPVSLALELGFSYDIIGKLINNGADIREKEAISFGKYDRYPFSIALDKELSLDFIKLVYNDSGIPPIHIIGMLKLKKPSDEITEYLLKEMDEYLEQDDYMKEWKESKWEAKFWNKGELKQPYLHIHETYWNPSTSVQAIGRAVRSTPHATGKSFDIPDDYISTLSTEDILNNKLPSIEEEISGIELIMEKFNLNSEDIVYKGQDSVFIKLDDRDSWSNKRIY